MYNFLCLKNTPILLSFLTNVRMKYGQNGFKRNRNIINSLLKYVRRILIWSFQNVHVIFKDTSDLSGGVLAKAIKAGLDSSKFLLLFFYIVTNKAMLEKSAGSNKDMKINKPSENWI